MTTRINFTVISNATATIGRLNELKKQAEATWSDEKLERLQAIIQKMQNESDKDWFATNQRDDGLVIEPGYKLELVLDLLEGKREMPRVVRDEEILGGRAFG